ncbi:hypothetical protein HDU87_006627 [Geranomyces variabilis]|uniref:NAD(P)-binding domain-containing protein n=1 Tax=Geranomyces variabilis TaxID=109894 RepID=A0AAD5TEV5_9FUNG|nr:hypothetical protein HDU87_006627 [Geranomyces variabilis]
MASILLTGATGTVGSQVLTLLIESPAVSKVTIVARRTTPDVVSEKVHHVIAKDFGTVRWQDITPGIDAVIWCMGGKFNSLPLSMAEYEAMVVTWPLACASALAPTARFVDISGAFVSRTETAGKSVGWDMFEIVTRNLKGRFEARLLELPGLSKIILQPCGIVDASTGLAARAMVRGFPSRVIDVKSLATVAVHAALHGPNVKGKDTYANAEIGTWAKELQTAPGLKNLE